MKRIILFLLLTISVSGVTNAQGRLRRIETSLNRTSRIATQNLARKIRKIEQASRAVSIQTGVAAQETTWSAVSSPQVPQTLTGVKGGEPATSFQLPSSKQKGFMLPHELPYHAMPAGLQNEGFKPQIHNVAPAAILLDNDNLLQEMQRQEILSIKHDKLREKIYKSLNKLNSTEWESTITGYIIYNNEYEYILDAT